MNEAPPRYDRFGRRTRDGALGDAWEGNGNPWKVVYPGEVAPFYTYGFGDCPESLAVPRSGVPDPAVPSGACGAGSPSAGVKSPGANPG